MLLPSNEGRSSMAKQNIRNIGNPQKAAVLKGNSGLFNFDKVLGYTIKYAISYYSTAWRKIGAGNRLRLLFDKKATWKQLQTLPHIPQTRFLVCGSFLFDNLSQYPLSKDENAWDNLQFNWQWVIPHTSEQSFWQPYIAKYP